MSEIDFGDSVRRTLFLIAWSFACCAFGAGAYRDAARRNYIPTCEESLQSLPLRLTEYSVSHFCMTHDPEYLTIPLNHWMKEYHEERKQRALNGEPILGQDPNKEPK